MTLTQLPTSFSKGTTVIYTRTSSDYRPTQGWSLTLYIAGVSTLSKLATASGDVYTITLAAADTNTLTPGNYTWVERATKGAEVYDFASGQLTVTPNLATAAAGDLQSWDEKMLAVVEAALLASGGSDVVSYQIHGRGVTRTTREDAMRLRDKLKLRVQRARNGGKIGQQIFGRFRRPS